MQKISEEVKEMVTAANILEERKNAVKEKFPDTCSVFWQTTDGLVVDVLADTAAIVYKDISLFGKYVDFMVENGGSLPEDVVKAYNDGLMPKKTKQAADSLMQNSRNTLRSCAMSVQAAIAKTEGENNAGNCGKTEDVHVGTQK